jgi:hypothetical protein
LHRFLEVVYVKVMVVLVVVVVLLLLLFAMHASMLPT